MRSLESGRSPFRLEFVAGEGMEAESDPWLLCPSSNQSKTTTSMYVYMYVYIRINICVCVCVCVYAHVKHLHFAKHEQIAAW